MAEGEKPGRGSRLRTDDRRTSYTEAVIGRFEAIGDRLAQPLRRRRGGTEPDRKDQGPLDSLAKNFCLLTQSQGDVTFRRTVRAQSVESPPGAAETSQIRGGSAALKAGQMARKIARSG